jgi:TPR repeat protein
MTSPTKSLAIILGLVIVSLALTGKALAIDPRAEQLWEQSRGKTYAEALPYLQEAARLGHPRAQSTLAHYYWARQDYAQAAHWNQLAASQGVRDAQYNLAGMYTDGLGVPVDLRRAAELLDASAHQNYAPAQESLGICYEFGEGVVRNRQNATYWLSQAAAQGSQSAATLHNVLTNPATPQFASEGQFLQWYNTQQQRVAAAQGRRCYTGLSYSSCGGSAPVDSIGQSHDSSGRQCNTLVPSQICH